MVGLIIVIQLSSPHIVKYGSRMAHVRTKYLAQRLQYFVKGDAQIAYRSNSWGSREDNSCI